MLSDAFGMPPLHTSISNVYVLKNFLQPD